MQYLSCGILMVWINAWTLIAQNPIWYAEVMYKLCFYVHLCLQQDKWHTLFQPRAFESQVMLFSPSE